MEARFSEAGFYWGNRTKHGRIPVNSLSDAAAFCEMVRVKCEFEQQRLGL